MPTTEEIQTTASPHSADEEEDQQRIKKRKKNKNGMNKKGETRRASWKDSNVVKCFLETCIQEASINGKLGSSLKPESWTKVKAALKKEHNIEVNQRQMKNHYDYLKEKFHAWLQISQITGNMYNLAANTINWTDAEWEEHIKAHPKARTLRNSPLRFPDLCMKLFDGVVAAGVQASEPSTENLRPDSSSSLPAINEDLLQIEYTPAGSQDSSNSIPSTPDSHSYASEPSFQEDKTKEPKCSLEAERPKKKSKKASSINDEIMKALKMIIQSGGPSVEDCIAKLDRVGWNETSSLYIVAHGIFAANDGYRRSWMHLNEDNKQLLENWVMIIGKSMGYVVDTST